MQLTTKQTLAPNLAKFQVFPPAPPNTCNLDAAYINPNILSCFQNLELVPISTYKCHFSVDCHEYARGQYMHDDDWKKYSRPYICGMHDYYFPKADLLTTVCDGIANCLEHEETLRRKVQVVRSVPFYSEQKLLVRMFGQHGSEMVPNRSGMLPRCLQLLGYFWAKTFL